LEGAGDWGRRRGRVDRREEGKGAIFSMKLRGIDGPG